MKLGRSHLQHCLRTESLAAFRNNDRLKPGDLIIGPNSIDVTLHPKLLIPQNRSGRQRLDPCEGAAPYDLWSPFTMMDSYVLSPGAFVLGAASERFMCHEDMVPRSLEYQKCGIAQMYEGRSTCARIGLESHLSAGFGDVGFSGAFTLEIVNNSPWEIVLTAGMRVGQVAFEVVYGIELEDTYLGAYAGTNHNDGPVAPLLGRERFLPKTDA